MIKPGIIINNRYQLLDLIEESEKLAVYKALTLSGEELRAVKIVRPRLLSNSRVVDRMIAEIQNVASIRHDSMAAVYDVDYADGMFYIAMEWVEGRVLTDFIDRGLSLPVSRAMGVVKKLAYLLDFAHKQGMKYRSIKLSNIMITEDFRVKVLGFNLPRSTMAVNGVRIGESRGTDPDIFFLGVVLYTLLEGRIPIKKRDFVITDLRLLHYLEIDCDWRLSRPDMEHPVRALTEELIQRSVTRDMPRRIDGFADFLSYLERIGSALCRDSGTTARSVMETLDLVREEQAPAQIVPEPSAVEWRKVKPIAYPLLISGLILLVYMML